MAQARLASRPLAGRRGARVLPFVEGQASGRKSRVLMMKRGARRWLPLGSVIESLGPPALNRMAGDLGVCRAGRT